MEVVEFSGAAPSDKRGAVVALGTFDGMHLEDQRVIDAAATLARRTGAVASALLFEPHPRRLLHPEEPPFNLMTADQRSRALEARGLERVYLGMFSPALATLAPSDFIHQVMQRQVGAAAVCASTRVQFGRSDADRAAFIDTLRSVYGDSFVAVEPLRDVSGAYVASADIRSALQRGDLDAAARALGRRYAIEGPVIHGAKLGRTIGFPTLNVPLGEYLRPALGIYASLTALPDGRRLPGVSYIGRRPTVHGVEELLETFLFDFHESVYGRTVQTELVAFIRPDKTFDAIEDMRLQIAKDCDLARQKLLERTEP